MFIYFDELSVGSYVQVLDDAPVRWQTSVVVDLDPANWIITVSTTDNGKKYKVTEKEIRSVPMSMELVWHNGYESAGAYVYEDGTIYSLYEKSGACSLINSGRNWHVLEEPIRAENSFWWVHEWQWVCDQYFHRPLPVLSFEDGIGTTIVRHLTP